MGNPTVTCDKCGSQMTVQPVGNGFPPKVFANRLRKQCREKGCDGEPRYRAGIAFGPRAHGMEAE